MDITQRMAARFQQNYDGPSNRKTNATKSRAVPDDEDSTGVFDVLKMYCRKPTLKPAHMAWADSRPGFAEEVDRRLAEVRQEKAEPEYSRIALWNTMAAAGYAAASDEVKMETLKGTQTVLSGQLKRREDFLAPPRSIEEASK